MFSDLGDPLLRDVLERGGTNYAEAQQEHICTGVTQGAQLVKLFLDEVKTVEMKQSQSFVIQNSGFLFCCCLFLSDVILTRGD